MNIENYNDYLNYKIKTVYQYSTQLSKILGIEKNKFWHKRKDIETTLDFIIKDYFNRMTKEVDKDLIHCFINNKDISKYHLDREIQSTLNYFIENERAFEIKVFEKEIILCAITIYIANNLDISTSPYTINKNNYKTILLSYLEKFNKISYIDIIDDGKKNTNILLEMIKTNVRKERRIFELLNSNISFNKYIDISKEDIYYLTQYNYSVPNIKDVDSNAANYIFDKDNFANKFSLISIDLVITTFMKLLSVRKFNKTFFIPIKKNFLLDDNSLNKIKLINKYKYLKENIILLINYNDIDELVLKNLNKYNLNYYIYASKNTKVDSNILEKDKNYLVSKEFYNEYKEIIDELKKEKQNIIVESFDSVLTDRMIIEAKEN